MSIIKSSAYSLHINYSITVGGLSAINAVAGAYSDNLPLVVISGCPNSNDYGTERILHHTVGLPNFNQTFRCFQNVTCHCCIIKSIENAAREIDYAFEMAIKMKKPVYIEISCNLPAIKHYSFMDPPPMCGFPKQSNQDVLDKVAKDIVDMLKGAVKPVLVVGNMSFAFCMCPIFSRDFAQDLTSENVMHKMLFRNLRMHVGMPMPVYQMQKAWSLKSMIILLAHIGARSLLRFVVRSLSLQTCTSSLAQSLMTIPLLASTENIYDYCLLTSYL